MNAAFIPQLTGIVCDQRIQIVYGDTRLGNMLCGDLVPFDHVFIGLVPLLGAGRGGSPDELGFGGVALDRAEHIRKPFPVGAHVSMQAEVEVDDRIGVHPEHQFELVK